MKIESEVFAVPLRLGEPSDAPCISVLGMQVFLDTYATRGVSPSLATEVLERLSPTAVSALFNKAATRFIVAEREGHLMAFAQLTLGATHRLLADLPASEVNRLYVQERFAGTGLGTLLLRQAESLVAAQGNAAVWLTAWSGNERALAFYANRGYRDLGCTTYVFGGEAYENRLFLKHPLGSGAQRS